MIDINYINEHYLDMDWQNYAKNDKNITIEIIDKYKQYLNFYTLSANPYLSNDILKKYNDVLIPSLFQDDVYINMSKENIDIYKERLCLITLFNYSTLHQDFLYDNLEMVKRKILSYDLLFHTKYVQSINLKRYIESFPLDERYYVVFKLLSISSAYNKVRFTYINFKNYIDLNNHVSRIYINDIYTNIEYMDYTKYMDYYNYND